MQHPVRFAIRLTSSPRVGRSASPRPSRLCAGWHLLRAASRRFDDSAASDVVGGILFIALLLPFIL